MRKVTLIVVFIIVSLFSFSQKNELSSAYSILDLRKEVFIKFPAKPFEVQSFANIMSVDKYDGKFVYAYANRKEFDFFLLSGKDFEINDEYYNKSRALTMAGTVAEMLNWDRYPTYEVYVELMETFAADYPDICKLELIGFTTDGRKLLSVKISDNVNDDEAEPEFLYTGMMHGDELVGGMVLLKLIDHLLLNYGSDSQITNLIDTVQIYINPFANPDGTYYGGNNTVADAVRYNNQEIDLNRNYKDFIYGDHNDGNEYGTETSAFMDYASNHKFVMSANTHSGIELVNYPYDTDPTLPADNEWWIMVSREYADNAQAVSPSGYFDDEDNGITNGYAWYQAIGSRQDYMNYYHYCKEVTLELSTTKLVDAEELPDYWNYNKQALIDYLDQVTYGLRGIVTDSITDLPLEAMVYIEGYDFFNSHVYSFPEHGDYYRLLKAGEYEVTFSAPGYRSKTITVLLNDYQVTNLDVELANLEYVEPTANFETEIQSTQCNPLISFINTSEASSGTDFLWDFGDGSSTSSEANPMHTYTANGTYTVKLYATNTFGTDSLIREEYININLTPLTNIPSYAVCAASGVVNADLGLSGTFYWYADAFDEIPFHTGTTYTTPELSENTTYYIQQMYQGSEFNGGETDNSEGGSYVSDNTDNYLIFNCTQECLLKTVKVYADGAGTRTIYLKSSLGQILASSEIYIEDGMQIVELNFDIPVGTNMRIGCESTANLYRGSVGIFENFDFPFSIGGIIELVRSNEVWWGDGTKYYAYFYDWNIKLPDCYSERSPLNIFINEAAVAGFSYLSNDYTVAFTNTSTGADSYLWEFGDETFSIETNPIHEYSLPGEYSVKLSAESDCGADEYTATVIVSTGIDQNEVNLCSIFPNPADKFIKIQSQKLISEISIYDLSGKQILKIDDLYKLNSEINISDLHQGVYFIKIISSDKDITVTKLTKF